MNLRVAIVSDLHIALPATIHNHPYRFHLVEISIPVLELVFQHLESLNLDFILIPGDLTQDGEPENHQWLQQRLASLPFPAYVVPGNHDVPTLLPTNRTIGFHEFSHYYRQFGYDNSRELYYLRELCPGVQLIALNSNQFDNQGKQIGCLDKRQLAWLEQTLLRLGDQFILVMVHHNVIEHLPGQYRHELGRRYMLDNAPNLLKILRNAGVKLIFTGHLHVQDIAQQSGIYEITTGSPVSYPHPYRILELRRDRRGEYSLTVESHRIDSVANWENLQERSRNWMGDRSHPFMMRLLTAPPLSLPVIEAEQLAPQLRYFWSDIAAGDTLFDFPNFPPLARQYFQKFGAVDAAGIPTFIDNQVTLFL